MARRPLTDAGSTPRSSHSDMVPLIVIMDGFSGSARDGHPSA